MSNLLENENIQHQVLLSICSGLGHYSHETAALDEPADRTAMAERTYILGGETLDCLKDLKKLLKMDINGGNGSEKTMFKKLGSWNIVKQHLVPLFIHHAVGKYVKAEEKAHGGEPPVEVRGELAEENTTNEPKYIYMMSGKNKSYSKLVLEILVALTWPQEYGYENHGDMAAEEEGTLAFGRHGFRHRIPLYALDSLVGYKEALLDSDFLNVFVDIWMHALTSSKRKRENAEYAQNVIQLSLFLIRNCLMIPDDPLKVKESSRALSDRFIVSLAKARVLQLAMTMCSEMLPSDEGGNAKYTEWSILLLEVFSMLFYARDPQDLLNVVKGKSASIGASRTSGMTELKTLMALEKQRQKPTTTTRHGKFGGSYDVTLATGQNVIQNVLGVVGTGIRNNSCTLDYRKRHKYWRKAGTSDLDYFKPIKDDIQLAKVLLYFSHEFILSGAMAGLLGHLFEKEIRLGNMAKRDGLGGGLSEQDHFRFVWFSRFLFTTVKVEGLSKDGKFFDETLLSKEFSRYLIQRIAMYYSGESTTETAVLPLYLHVYVSCLGSYLTLISLHPDPLKSQHLQANLYYDHEKLQMLVHLTKDFSPAKQTMGYLQDLIYLNYTLLKMMASYCASGLITTITKKRSKVKVDLGSDEKAVTVNQDGKSNQGDLQISEMKLSFEKFEGYFMNDCILDKYILYLNYLCDKIFAENNLVNDYGEKFHQSAKMLHAMFVKYKLEPLFYKMSVLIVFERVYSLQKVTVPAIPKDSSKAATSTLFEFVDYVMFKFFKKWKEYPLMVIELFYPKSHRDIDRIQNSNKKVNEEERDIFMDENKVAEPEDSSSLLPPDKSFQVYQKTLLRQQQNDSDVLVQDWKDNVILIMNTLKRFKKQNMLYWLVHTMKSFITQRQEQSTLGLDFEGAAESAGNSELGIHSASERILSVEAFPEYARFLRDPLFGQLLSLLFQQQESINSCWRITGELTNDQLNSYIDLVNENISSKSIESTIEFESDQETYVEEEQENNLKLQFVNEKAPSKKKRIISKRTSKAINKIANENAREISVSINGFDTDANSLVLATVNTNVSLTTPDVDDYSETEYEKDLEKIVFLPKPKRGIIQDDDEEELKDLF